MNNLPFEIKNGQIKHPNGMRESASIEVSLMASILEELQAISEKLEHVSINRKPQKPEA